MHGLCMTKTISTMDKSSRQLKEIFAQEKNSDNDCKPL